MKQLLDDDKGQMILMTCVAIALALILISVYEINALSTGEGSINREDMDSFYYYNSVRERYNDMQTNPDLMSNVSELENEFRQVAVLHGYSVNFVHKNNGTQTQIMFVDKGLTINETIP